MYTVEEVLYYIRSLKKGFDKDEFKEKVESLAESVDSGELDYEDFHTLFKVWLNLRIPVTKWTSIGICLVPREKIQARTVEYALRWLLSNYQNQVSFSRICFVLDWLTAAMNSNSIDMKALDAGYEIFYLLITYEILTPSAIKLIYTLSKPGDVTRRRVLELLDISRLREAKNSKCRQIQVLLGLFKSYRPECVPESIPAFSVHTTFKKINVQLTTRFSRSEALRNCTNKEKPRLLWVNPLNMKGKKKTEPLVPNMEFANLGSKQYTEKELKKTFFDFMDPSSLIQYSLHHSLSRPARLRAFLCNDSGLTLLATAPDYMHAFLSHELQQVLTECFLYSSPYSYEEKQDLLRRLSRLQRTMMQGIPVVTRFLAQYVPLWNEKDFFFEILELAEWLSVDSPTQMPYVVRPLGRIYHRSPPLEQCAILNCLVNLYCNLSFASSRERHHFMSMPPSPHYKQLMSSLAMYIEDICTKSVQVTPSDLRPLHSSIRGLQRVCRSVSSVSMTSDVSPPPSPSTLVMALPLLSYSAGLVANVVDLLLVYIQLYSKLKKKMESNRKFEDQLWTIQAYTFDLINCLWSEKILSERQTGLVFNKVKPQLAGRLSKSVPKADAALSLKSHIAFAPYTYTQFEAVDCKDIDNKLWLDTVIHPTFPSISKFLKKAVPELRN